MGPVRGGEDGKEKEEKEDVGYRTRECIHLKAESGKNKTPRRDKGQRVKGRERGGGGRNRGEGPGAVIIYGWSFYEGASLLAE